jgi:hypothetical protein
MISQIINFCGYQFNLAYDPAVITITGEEAEAGITPGMIGSTVIPIDVWRFNPVGTQGKVTILGHTVGSVGVTGSGYIIQIHFRAIGNAGTKSSITLSDLKLFNDEAMLITPVTNVDGVIIIMP